MSFGEPGVVACGWSMAIEEQVRAYGGPRLQLTQHVLTRFAEAIQASQVDVVPKILISGHNGQQGGSPMSSGVARRVLSRFQHISPKKDETTDYLLTPREKEVLSLIVQGKSYKMIAGDLSIGFENEYLFVQKKFV